MLSISRRLALRYKVSSKTFCQVVQPLKADTVQKVVKNKKLRGIHKYDGYQQIKFSNSWQEVPEFKSLFFKYMS